MVAVYADDNNEPGDLISTTRYDGLNHRIRKIVEGDVTYDYYYSGYQVVEVHEDGDDEYPLEQYVWDIRYVHSPVLRWRDEGTDGQDIETLYYCNDANFNVTALIATDGTPVERYVYDPYGQRKIFNGSWSEISWANSKKNEILFTGHRLNVESGLYYGGWRYYHPTLGLWIGREDMYRDSLSLYEYVGSNPLVRVDPTGRFWDTAGQAIGKAKRAIEKAEKVAEKVGQAVEAVGGAIATAAEAVGNWFDQNSPEMAATRFAIGGRGSQSYFFKPGDAFLEIVRNDPFMEEVRGRVRETLQDRCKYPACDTTPYTKENDPHEYKSKGIIGDLELVRDYAYAGLQFAPVPSMGLQALGATKASAYLGAYNVKWKAENIKCCSGKAKIAFHVWDFWNAETLSNLPFTGPLLPESPFGESGPIGGTTWLNFDWEEDIEFKGDSKCVDK